MALPLFVRKLTAPVEVKLVLSALSEEVRHLNSGSDRRSLGSAIATGIITPKVVRDILDWSKEIKADIQKGKPPRVIALYLMMNVVRDHLASGKFHIWRGKLSMQGQALKGMNAYCLDELVKLGQMTEETKTAALNATRGEMLDVW